MSCRLVIPNNAKPSANDPVAKYPPGSTEPYFCLTTHLFSESLLPLEKESLAFALKKFPQAFD